ncbi:cupin [Pseudomonas oryzicola]|uniref:Cupin n=1 Tax=Pseudomonas oryzicola TaxID=485876 RepID=A0ABS6QC68_9PSED|nr:cupin [Pseudomonas oryzicola]MBV4491774.1 cupin [Pseudomonas oryzicola]
MTLHNLLTDLPPCAITSAERIDELLSRPGLRVERIVSTGQASPPGFWYDQAEGEWVVLLSGAAGLRFEHEDHTRLLVPGDCLDIPPHYRHRVEWTAPGTASIWLAVFYNSGSPWPA